MFKIAAGERNATDVVFVVLEHNGIKGYGEVALPPYLPDTAITVTNFLTRIALPENYDDGQFTKLLEAVYDQPERCYPAIAAFDIALHDLQGKLLGETTRALYGIAGDESPPVAYTIGMASAEELEKKIKEAPDFKFFKLKLGGGNDKKLVNCFRSFTNTPFGVDVNRGWNNIDEAVTFSSWLEKMGCVFIEQPFEKEELAKTMLLKTQLHIPVLLDESVQTIDDVERVKPYCDGINIKLAKCGGIYPAWQMINKARGSGLKIFIGCMSEGSCGIAGAAQLASLADWVDLDGPLLIDNDPFEGVNYRNGRIMLNNWNGNGVKPIHSR